MMKKMNPHSANSLSLRLWQIAAFGYFCFTLYALFSPRPHLGQVGIPTFSLIHTAAFGVLGGLIEMGRGHFSRPLTWGLLLLYGPLTEILQPLTGRCFQSSDIVEDLIGVIMGIGAATILKRFQSTHSL